MKLFYDILIILGISMTALPAVILLYNIKYHTHSIESKNPRITKIISIILLSATTILIWGSFIEPYLIVIRKHTIDIPQIKKPITIAFIADMQIGTYKQSSWTQRIVNKMIKLNPDIILLGGDNIDNAIYDEKETSYLTPLKTLSKKIPIYAIPGNHEYGIGGGKSIDNPKYRVADMSQRTEQTMESLGITYLTNELKEIYIHDESFYLFGGDSLWAKKLDYSILNTRTKNIPTIGLIHNPAFILKKFPLDIDLYLSGHTHGGQIRLPFIGPIGRVDDILPTKYYQGLHNLGTNTKLFVTSGIGETGTRARLFNPPEIVLITLQ